MIFENFVTLIIGSLFGFTLYWIAWKRGYNAGKSSAIEMMLDLIKEIERIKKEKDEVSKL